MTRRVLIVFSALILSSSVFAQRATIKELKKDISYLASDELGGRASGSKGAALAADYLIQRYENLKIPAYRAAYKHPFEFNRGWDWAGSSIHINGKKLVLGVDGFPLAFSSNGQLEGSSLLGVNEKAGIWISPLYDEEANATNAHFDTEKEAWDKAKEAAQAGAKAIVLFDNYGAKYPMQFNKKTEQEKLKIPVVFVQHQAWKKLISEEESSVEIGLNIKLDKKNYTGNNVAAYLDNHQPLTVIIGAHYDHLGHGEDGNSLYTGKTPEIHNGADDNASGTAALLQLAKWLKKAKLKQYNYLFLHFSGEEMGLLGSKAIAKEAGIDSSRIAYMINMDMVGRLVDSTKAITLGGVGSSPSWGTAVKTLQEEGFRVKIDSSGIGPSDHTSFYEKGIPVLFFFTGTHHDYHKPSDDADKINYAGEALVLKGIERIISQMDVLPRPVFTPTKNSTMGRVSFKVTLGIMPDYSWTGEGLRVDGIIDNRPAQQAGLQADDVIIQIGKDKVKGIQTYMQALGHLNFGEKTTVVVLRKGKTVALPVEF